MRHARLSIRLGVLMALLLAPANAVVGQVLCSDYNDESECSAHDCFWCPSYGFCIKNPVDDCFCENLTTEHDCQSAPLCQWCGDSVYGLPASECRSREGESCWCGNAEWDSSAGEECDSTAHCTADCRCERNYVSVDGVCVPDCGDGLLIDSEECEFVNGIQTPHCISCMCEAGYIPHPTDPAEGCGQPPSITSAADVMFTVGQAGSFTVTATGAPTPALTSFGMLPSGVGFTDNGDGTASLSGTPAMATGGTYLLDFDASSTFGTANQPFTLIVQDVLFASDFETYMSWPWGWSSATP